MSALPPSGDFEQDSIISDKLRDDPSIIAAEFNRDYWRVNPLIYPFWAEAYRDLQIYSGNQWNEAEKQFLVSQNRSAFVYNKVFSAINAIVGYRAKNPFGFQVNAVYNDDNTIADMYTDIIRHVFYKNNGYRVLNEAVRSAAVTGVSFLNCYPDFREDAISGDIKIGMDYWNAVIFDPFLTKRSLEDASFVARRKYVSRDVAASLLPEHREEIMSIPLGRRDSKFYWIPYARQAGMNTLIAYTEYWKQRWVQSKVLINRRTGEITPWEDGPISIKSVLQQNPDITIMTKPVKTVSLSILVEDRVLFHRVNPYGINRYPMVMVTGVFDPSNDIAANRFQGLTRIVRDSQIEYNKRRSQTIDILESQMNSGWIYKENSICNLQSLYKGGQGGLVGVKQHESINEALQRISPPAIPESSFAIEASLENDIAKGLGTNYEVMGRSENYSTEQSAMLFKMRQDSGLIPLEFFYDGVRESQKELGMIILEMARKNYIPEKVQKITNKAGVPIEFYSQTISEYGLVVEEGLIENTATSLPQLMMLRKEGIPISDELIVKSTSLYEKQDVLNELAQTREAQATQQQQQQQQEMESQQVLMQTLQSKAMVDEAAAHEKQVNSIRTLTETQTEADYKIADTQRVRADSVSKLIKSIKDLSETDIDRLLMAMGFVSELKNEERIEGSLEKETLPNFNEEAQVIPSPSPTQEEQAAPPQDFI